MLGKRANTPICTALRFLAAPGRIVCLQRAALKTDLCHFVPVLSPFQQESVIVSVAKVRIQQDIFKGRQSSPAYFRTWIKGSRTHSSCSSVPLPN